MGWQGTVRGALSWKDPLNLWVPDGVMIPCFSSGLSGSIGGVEGSSLSFHSEPTSIRKDLEVRWLNWAETSSRPRRMWPSTCYTSLTDVFIDAHTLGSSRQFQPSSFWQLESLVWLSPCLGKPGAACEGIGGNHLCSWSDLANWPQGSKLYRKKSCLWRWPQSSHSIGDM